MRRIRVISYSYQSCLTRARTVSSHVHWVVSRGKLRVSTLFPITIGQRGFSVGEFLRYKPRSRYILHVIDSKERAFKFQNDRFNGNLIFPPSFYFSFLQTFSFLFYFQFVYLIIIHSFIFLNIITH